MAYKKSFINIPLVFGRDRKWVCKLFAKNLKNNELII